MKRNSLLPNSDADEMTRFPDPQMRSMMDWLKWMSLIVSRGMSIALREHAAAGDDALGGQHEVAHRPGQEPPSGQHAERDDGDDHEAGTPSPATNR